LNSPERPQMWPASCIRLGSGSMNCLEISVSCFGAN